MVAVAAVGRCRGPHPLALSRHLVCGIPRVTVFFLVFFLWTPNPLCLFLRAAHCFCCSHTHIPWTVYIDLAPAATAYPFPPTSPQFRTRALIDSKQSAQLHSLPPAGSQQGSCAMLGGRACVGGGGRQHHQLIARKYTNDDGVTTCKAEAGSAKQKSNPTSVPRGCKQ